MNEKEIKRVGALPAEQWPSSFLTLACVCVLGMVRVAERVCNKQNWTAGIDDAKQIDHS